MKTIIGQKKLVSIFSEYTPATMPSTLMLFGEKGSGKTHLIQRLGANLGLEVVSLSSQTTAEELIDFMQSPILKIYHLDLCGVTEKAQNKFLKFIEEPPATVKIILEARSEVGVLPTILNRCLKFSLEPYTVEELQSFSWAPKVQDLLLYRFYDTPGKLNTLGNAQIFADLQNFCNTIIVHFPTAKQADYANAMTLSNKICTKKEEAYKFDLDIFLDVFAYMTFEHYKSTGQSFSFEAYLATVQQKQKLLNKTVAKEAVILNFLNHLWEVAHDVTRT